MTDEMEVSLALEVYRAKVREYDQDFRTGLESGAWREKYGTTLHSTGLGEVWAMRAALEAVRALRPAGEPEEWREPASSASPRATFPPR